MTDLLLNLTSYLATEKKNCALAVRSLLNFLTDYLESRVQTTSSGNVDQLLSNFNGLLKLIDCIKMVSFGAKTMTHSSFTSDK